LITGEHGEKRRTPKGALPGEPKKKQPIEVLAENEGPKTKGGSVVASALSKGSFCAGRGRRKKAREKKTRNLPKKQKRSKQGTGEKASYTNARMGKGSKNNKTMRGGTAILKTKGYQGTSNRTKKNRKTFK